MSKNFLPNKKIPDEFDADPVIEAVDCDRIFSRLMEAVMTSPFGSVLNMFGGAAALQPLREPFVEKVQAEIRLLLSSRKFLDAVQKGLNTASHTDEMIDKVDAIVMQRLNELTPEMVKTIVQDMIHKHLGWLVVWGRGFWRFYWFDYVSGRWSVGAGLERCTTAIAVQPAPTYYPLALPFLNKYFYLAEFFFLFRRPFAQSGRHICIGLRHLPIA